MSNTPNTVVTVSGGIVEVVRGHATVLDLDVLDSDLSDSDVAVEVCDLWERVRDADVVVLVPGVEQWLRKSPAVRYDSELDSWAPIG